MGEWVEEGLGNDSENRLTKHVWSKEPQRHEEDDLGKRLWRLQVDIYQSEV